MTWRRPAGIVLASGGASMLVWSLMFTLAIGQHVQFDVMGAAGAVALACGWRLGW